MLVLISTSLSCIGCLTALNFLRKWSLMKAALVGETLKKARKARGFTQAELASRLGVTGSAVGQWEQGRTTPGWRQAQQLEELLGEYVTQPDGATPDPLLRRVVELAEAVESLTQRVHEMGGEIEQLRRADGRAGS